MREFEPTQISQSQRMSGKRAATAASKLRDEGRLRAETYSTETLRSVNQVDDILHIQMCIPLNATNISVTTNHHYLRLIEPHPCNFRNARMTKLVKPNV